MTEYKTEITLLRHATLTISIGGKTFLVDPMLGAKDSMDPVQNASNNYRIPMVDLPIQKSELIELIEGTDVVLLTHSHRDHWDKEAQHLIPSSKLIVCQPEDSSLLEQQGFTNVSAIQEQAVIEGISIDRTSGQHGTGEIGRKMGPVSGFVLKHRQYTIYIAGDTIWCPEVEAALEKHAPNMIILNAGAAQFLEGDPITMTEQDILKVLDKAPEAQIICVHMDTVNHCRLKRDELRKFMQVQAINHDKLLIPNDGESLSL